MSSDTEFLAPDELRALTGFKPAAKQDAWLSDHGIPHRRDGRRLIVSRFHVRRAVVKAEIRELTGKRLDAFLLRPDMPRIRAGQYPAGGEMAGLYAQFDSAGELVYIGKSVGVGYRAIQHLWSAQRGERPPYATYIVVEVPDLERDGLEVAHIHALQPPLNCLPRVTWDRHEDAVAWVKKAWGRT